MTLEQAWQQLLGEGAAKENAYIEALKAKNKAFLDGITTDQDKQRHLLSIGRGHLVDSPAPSKPMTHL